MTPTQNTPVQPNQQKLYKRCLKSDIRKTLLHFKFNQLITDVILNLFILEPAEVNEKLNELKLPFSKASVAILLCSRCQAFSVQELQDIHQSLQLYRTAFASKSKKWIPMNLLDPAEDLDFPTDERIIRRNILQALRIKGLNAIVKVITYEELKWVMITEKKLTRKKGVKLLTPVYICYEVGMPFIFVAAKISAIIMECILKAMKYKSHKLQQLEGKDVKSLMALLKYKAMNGSQCVVPYKEGEAIIGRRFIDVSKKKSRESYVNKVFDTKEPINLETFHVVADAEWRNSEVVPEMNGEPFKVSMTLKSKNLIEMIKYMVSSDMVPTPLPDYLQAILRCGKNKISMKSK